VYEDAASFWLEGDLRGQQRRGHLHSPEDACPTAAEKRS
jgi:hypothetical protein